MLEQFDAELKSILEGVAIVDQDPRRATGKVSAGPHDFAHAGYRKISRQLAKGQREMVSQLRQLFSVKFGFAHCERVISNWERFAARCDHAAIASLHWDAMTSDFSHVVKSMKTPVLVICGDATVAPEDVCERTARCIPPRGAHRSILPGGSHMIFQQPELLPELLRLIGRLLDGRVEVNTPCGQTSAHVIAASVSVQALQTQVILHCEKRHVNLKSPHIPSRSAGTRRCRMELGGA
jgi:pimeloyl-ACP methyl ester carboxylesterase